MKDYETAALVIGGYFILKGLGKLPSLATQAVETATVDVVNVPLGAQNQGVKLVYEASQAIQNLFNPSGNQSYVTPSGETMSYLQNPQSWTALKNEEGEGISLNWTNYANPLPANTYTGTNAWGDGIAILTDTHPISGDWISGVHLW